MTIKKSDEYLIEFEIKHEELASTYLISWGFDSWEELSDHKRIKYITSFPKNRRIGSQKTQDWLSFMREHDCFYQIKIKPETRKHWQEKYLEHLKPFCFLNSLTTQNKKTSLAMIWINPLGSKSNQDSIIPNDAVIFSLKASLAFGTGTHPTTHLSAKLLQKFLATQSPKSILDIGTGTGILAMTAYIYGVKNISAAEIDPDALKIAQENFKKHKMNEIQTIKNFSEKRKKYDLIIANILLKTLTELKQEILEKLKDNGTLILSGLLYRDVPELLKHYSECKLVKRINQKGWSALLLKKN